MIATACAVFVGVLCMSSIGAENENRYLAKDERGVARLSFVMTIGQGFVAWVVIADRSALNLIASAVAFAIAMSLGCRRLQG